MDFRQIVAQVVGKHVSEDGTEHDEAECTVLKRKVVLRRRAGSLRIVMLVVDLDGLESKVREARCDLACAPFDPRPGDVDALVSRIPRQILGQRQRLSPDSAADVKYPFGGAKSAGLLIDFQEFLTG